MTDAFIQVSILLLLGLFLGIPLGLKSIVLTYAAIFFLSIGIVSIGLIIGSVMESPEGFGLVVSFVAYPLFFLSGALFPIENLPPWLSVFVYLDPVTYGVDALREAILGTGIIPLHSSFAVLFAFAVVMVYIGTIAFERMKAY
jgi:ABC-2 type transport system permease protein